MAITRNKIYEIGEIAKEEKCKCSNVSGDNKMCLIHHPKKLAKLTPLSKEKKECNENWHIFQPAGAKVCNCGKSTENPLNKLADEAKKYNL